MFLKFFFGLRDKLGDLEPKKNIALKIYEQISPIYAKGPFPMKTKQKCLQSILKLREDYGNVTKDIKNYTSDNPSKKISKFKEQLDQNLARKENQNDCDEKIKSEFVPPSRSHVNISILKF